MNSRIYVDSYSFANRAIRFLWLAAKTVAFRPCRGIFFNSWRINVLRLFGAHIGNGCKVGATANIWAPWNLRMGDFVCIADGVDCYSAAQIVLGDYSTVSQRAYLCSASHDIASLARPLVSAPILIGPHAWVCAEAYVGGGVTVGEGAVVAARAVVTRSIEPWTVVGGNPARKIKDRVITENVRT